MDEQEPVASSSKIEPQRLPSVTHTPVVSPPGEGNDTNAGNVSGSRPYHPYSTWAGWPPPSYAGHNGTAQGYPHAHHHQTMSYPIPMMQQNQATSHIQASRKQAASPTPSPPLPKFYQHWDAVIKTFLSQAGLVQTLRSFEDDMLVLNPTWEQEIIPEALGKLRNNLELLDQVRHVEETSSRPCSPEHPLEERKLDYVHLSNGNKSQSQTSVNKSISAFLARNRAKNDESNRAEFLHAVNTGTETHKKSKFSCARTDAKHLDRDIQMKYDIAKNEEGPLRRTMKNTERPVSDKPPGSAVEGKPSLQGDDDGLISERHTGLDQRLANIEAHLAVRYVPSPPRTLLTRLKFLEDHLIMLEKEYPPWAALHFNQPNRGWPPPPRSTPIIVPAQLRSGTNASSPLPQGNPPEMLPTMAGGPKLRNTASSLHRAVLERLEVQQAINDLASGGSK